MASTVQQQVTICVCALLLPSCGDTAEAKGTEEQRAMVLVTGTVGRTGLLVPTAPAWIFMESFRLEKTLKDR